MTARVLARRLLLQTAGALFGFAVLIGLTPACYSAAGGTAPPTNELYFPVGLVVSPGGNVLYVANSDFDLQWNGGTLQSYNLFRLRGDVATLINANFGDPAALARIRASDGGGGIPFLSDDAPFAPCVAIGAGVVSSPPTEPSGARSAIGETCAPRVDSKPYQLDSVIVGAFATDLQLSRNGLRLFSPVRGDGTLTWADINPDSLDASPPASGGVFKFGGIQCGAGGDRRCDSDHHVGSVPDCADTRLATLPGEPFAMAQSEDGTAIVVTHQTANETSLLMSGTSPNWSAFNNAADGAAAPSALPLALTEPKQGSCPAQPSMQFVLSGVPNGGDGIVAVPHDSDAPVPPCELASDVAPCIRPAFLETNHSTAELDLLRYYDDYGSSDHRPFLVRESAFPLSVNAGGTDSRDIVIDPSPRLACKALGQSSAADCATLPARVFVASRTPPSLVVGQIGQPSVTGAEGYDPDLLVVTHNIPLTSGPSRLYLAPIIDRSGHYALRLFILCYDASQVFVYDPDAGMIENVINVGPGPFAMAFDPFDMQKVASRALVPSDPRQDSSLNLKTYRFAYLASFTQSYLQILDLDDSVPATSNTTFEKIVFTLGQPTNPKGS